MPFLLAGLAVSSASLRVPRYGMPTARVELQTVPTTPLVAGQRATLQLGDLSLVGTLLPAGGDFGDVASWDWMGGAAAWDQEVEARTYRDDSGILLSAVLADLALDAAAATGATDGTSFGAVLDGIPDRSLGYAWTRPTATASDLLRALAGDAWWVAPDGTTHVGARAASSSAPADLLVEAFDPATRLATVTLAGDGVSQLLPGTTLTAAALPAPLLIGQLEVQVETESVTATLWGERTGAELVAAVLEALTRRVRYAVVSPAQVTTVAGARSTVASSDARSADLAGLPFLDTVWGLPGASAVLQPGALVVVGWPGGDPGSPMIAGFLPGTLPQSLGLDAASTITLGTAGSTAPAARADKTDTAIAALLAGVNACAAALHLTPVTAPGSTAASKVLVE